MEILTVKPPPLCFPLSMVRVYWAPDISSNIWGKGVQQRGQTRTLFALPHTVLYSATRLISSPSKFGDAVALADALHTGALRGYRWRRHPLRCRLTPPLCPLSPWIVSLRASHTIPTKEGSLLSLERPLAYNLKSLLHVLKSVTFTPWRQIGLHVDSWCQNSTHNKKLIETRDLSMNIGVFS